RTDAQPPTPFAPLSNDNAHAQNIHTHPSPTAFPSSTSNIKTCSETHTSTTTHNTHQASPVSRSYACAPARRKPFRCTQSYPPPQIHSAPSIFTIYVTNEKCSTRSVALAAKQYNIRPPGACPTKVLQQKLSGHRRATPHGVYHLYSNPHV
ncbi:unnamed protein product, partial [Ectocarpus sp. 6 AP-2014]